jgi:trehalose 6-phosphate synthase
MKNLLMNNCLRRRGDPINNNFIMVTNREPYSHNKTKKGIMCRKSLGGVVSALDPLMKKHKGKWIAWGSGSADFTVCDSENRVLVPEKNPKYVLKRVHLSKKEIDNYYHGYSNSVLWPLFHLFVEKMDPREEYFHDYVKVNKKFAQSVLDEMSDEDLIWIHDYHLTLVPKFIKKEKPNAKIGFFWHIPWPPWEAFGSLSQRNEIIEGLLSCDLIGFHTSHYVKKFFECAEKNPEIKIDLEKGIITSHDNITKIKHFPLGISYKDFADSALSHAAEKKAKTLKKLHKNRSIILGLDRLDYTKGILNRLKAYEYFLDQNPELREKVVLVQIASPSRDKIDEYHNMKKEIDEAVGNINGRYGNEEWTPVMYFSRRMTQQSLLAYYKAADVSLLTPLRDGMNLIAKEYTASKDDDGVLILSEFAGASEELKEALLVNPFNIQETANIIKTAVEMPSEEKKQRFQILKEKVKLHDSEWWLDCFLKEWDKTYD